MPVFRLKRQVPYASVEIIDKELERLEKTGHKNKRIKKLITASGLHQPYML